MKDKLDDFVDNLQEQIFDEAHEVLGEAGFDRWQNPKFRGKLDEFDVTARVTGSCGDTMEIFLKFNKGRVVEGSYLTDGCGTSNVCGSFAVEFALNTKIEDLLDITGDDILAKLGQVPEDEQHCATLASGTLHEAVKIYMTTK